MPSIDERVVAMAFENAKFEALVAQTMATLAKLNEALAKVGTTSGLSNLEAEANKVTFAAPMSALEKLRAKLGFGEAKTAFADLEGASNKVSFSGITGALDKVKAKLGFPEAKNAFAQLEASDDKVNFSEATGAIDGITAKFGALQVAGITAFATIVSHATTQLGQLANKVTGISTVLDGFSDYNLKIGATQTIMAGTGESIGTVSKYLKELDTYADQTIYSLSDMTSNIGKFTNAGVSLPIATEAMKGISNEAALSGANTQEAARSMYNLGQAIGSGVVRLQDWRSVDLANMGTKEFKEQLIEAALATGSLKKGSDGVIRSLKGNEVNFKTFNTTLADQWLTAEALTKTLSKYADKNTDLGKRAYAAATQVKTFSMMLETLSAATGTGWTDTFEIIIGNLPEATKLWTGITNAIGGFIGKSADARNKALKTWDELGGRKALLDGLKNAVEAVGAVLKPVGEAFREIFPRKTGEDLLRLSENFRDFMAKLKIGPETADNLRRIFAGLFAVLHIGWTVVKELASAIFDLLGIVGKGSGGILNFAGSIGDFLVSLDKAISQGGLLKGVFAGIVSGLGGVIEVFKAVARSIASIFTGADNASGLSDSLKHLGDTAGPLKGLAEGVGRAWDRLVHIFDRVRDILKPAFDKIKEQVGDLADALGEAFKTENFDKVLSVLQTGFLGGILLVLRKFRSSLDITVGGGFFNKVNTMLGALTGNLKAMQQNLQAKTLFAIAISLGVLVAGIYALSTIDPKKLATAMTAMAVGMGQLVGALGLLSKFVGGGAGKLGIFMMPIIAAGMIGLAIAATILAAAVKIFSTMSWEEMIKGLVGVGGALAAVGAAMKLMGPMTLIQGPALIAIAVGLNILAAAVKQFADMSWEDLVKGLLGVAGAMVAIGLGTVLLGPSLVLVGPGLIAAALGVNMLAGAVSAFGSMDLKTLGKGILGVAAALVAIGLAISFIPPTVALQAAGLVILAVGLTGLTAAIGILGSMSIAKLVKGIIAMGGALVVLGVGLTAMTGTLIGSAALLAAAVAFAILGPTLAFLGTLEWGTIIKGLTLMALTLGVLAVAGLIVAAPITTLSFALGALGIALTLVTVPVYIFAKALELLGTAGSHGIAVMVTALTAFVALLPSIIINFLKGIVSIVKSVADMAPAVVDSIVKIINSILNVVIESTPKLAEAVSVLIGAFLAVIIEKVPEIIDAGFKLLVHFLSGISDNIGKVTAQAADIVVKFLDKITAEAPRIIRSGVNSLLSFLAGIAAQLPNVVAHAATVVVKFLEGVTSKLPEVVTKGVRLMVRFLESIASKIPDVVRAGTHVLVKLIEGLGNAVPQLVEAGIVAVGKFIRAVARALVKLVDVGFKAMIDFMHGLANAIRENDNLLIDAGFDIADAIIDGIVLGFKRLGGKAIDAVGDLIKSLPGKAKKVLGIDSPSKVFMEIGKFTMEGLTVGLNTGGANAQKVMTSVSEDVIGTAKATLGKVPNLLETMTDMQPVITPVLDLSQMEKDAQRIGDISNVVPITAAASFGQASAISAERDSAEAVAADQAAQADGPTFKFEQTNNSPKPLDEVEIYRQTKNQLSQVKSALGLV